MGGCSGFEVKKVPLSSKIEGILADLPCYMTEMYNDLMELYTQDELKWLRIECSVRIICQLYNEKFGPSFDTENVL